MIYILTAGFFTAIAIGWWLYSRGRRDREADVMEQINDDALKAVKAREAIDDKPIDAVRDELRARRLSRTKR